jgi:hypothetical protein
MMPWWLDTVCHNGRWNACVVHNAGGDVIGAMPYFVRRRFGLTFINTPPLTSYTDIWLHLPDDLKRERRYGSEQRIVGDLLSQLPKNALLTQFRLHPDYQNGLPMFWAGFRLNTYYTYILPDIADRDLVWADFRHHLRSDIRKSGNRVRIVSGNHDFAAAFGLHQSTLARQSLRPVHHEAAFRALDAQLQARQLRDIWFAEDPDTGQRHAAVYIMYQNDTAHFYMSGLEPSQKQSSALQFLIWHAISHCPPHIHRFDMEGSMDAGVEHALRAFGGIRTPYLHVSRTRNRWAQALIQLKG